MRNIHVATLLFAFALVNGLNSLLLSHSSGFAYDFMADDLQEYLAYIGEHSRLHTGLVSFIFLFLWCRSSLSIVSSQPRFKGEVR